jgi:integrase
VVTLSGRDIYLGRWNSPESRAEYDRRIAEWIAHGRRLPDHHLGGDYTVAELLVAYLKFAKTYYASEGDSTSEFTCLTYAVRPLRALYAHVRVNEFGPLALKTVRQKMVEQDLCRTQINRQINRIRRVFRWGVENELVPASILHALQAVAPLKRGRTEARESEPVRPVPDDHVDAVLPHVSRQVAAMIKLQRLTGARPGEVVLLRPCDVDRNDPVWIYRPHRHKTQYRSREREIFLGPKAQAVLRPWLVPAGGGVLLLSRGSRSGAERAAPCKSTNTYDS